MKYDLVFDHIVIFINVSFNNNLMFFLDCLQVRLLTLRILSLYHNQETTPSNEDIQSEGVEQTDVFTLCLRSEEQEATLANYR